MLVEPTDVARRDRDRRLVEAHCAGDSSVFPVIVREHYRALHAYAHRRLGNGVEAEDAVQEAFERAYRGLCRLDGEYRIGAWLHRIVANVCTDHAARRHVQRSLPERIGADRATAPDVSEHASDPVVLRAVQEALAALPAAQRQTFWLYEMSGLTYPEVAEHLGITEDNARARVHRARVALRRSLSRTRDAVAALILLPAGARAWLRRGEGAVLSASSAAAPQRATVAQAAYIATATPVTDLAASAASTGPSAVAVLAASVATVATVVGGVFAAPVVTSSSGSSTEPTAAAVAAPMEIVATGSGDDAIVTTTIEASTTDAVAAPAPTSAPVPKVAIDFEQDSWVIAGAEATGEVDWIPYPGATDPAVPRVDPCPWLADYPDVRASLPGLAPTIGGFESASGDATSAVSVAFTATTTLRIAGEPDGPPIEVPVSIRAQACLEAGSTALVADVHGPERQAVQLRAPAVTQLRDDELVFRGSVTPLAGGADSPLPWGLSDRFVAVLTVDRSAHTVALKVAFLGGLLDAAPPPPPDPPEIPAPATPTTTTLPTPSTTTTLPTPSTTVPSGSGGSSGGTSP